MIYRMLHAIDIIIRKRASSDKKQLPFSKTGTSNMVTFISLSGMYQLVEQILLDVFDVIQQKKLTISIQFVKEPLPKNY